MINIPQQQIPGIYHRRIGDILVTAVSDGYLETMRIPVLRGRGLRASDRGDAAPVALIDSLLAARDWNGRDPVGQRIRVGASEWSSAWASVFTAMNSTPFTSARIMRFTALLPPPPTPMTLICAKFSTSWAGP